MNKITDIFSRIGKKSEASSKIPRPFMNDKYKALAINYDNFFTFESLQVDPATPFFRQIRRISFEISNICNYSRIHNKCPASVCKEKKVLPSKIIYKTIDELAGVDYDGIFSFHRYNEPLIDPRLFDLIRYAKYKCRKSKILLLTNGAYLTQEIAEELAELDVWILVVSAYSLLEYERFIKLKVEIPYYVFFSVLDNRFDIYNAEPVNVKAPCSAPLGDITINVFGEVALCCLDWGNKYIFGNLTNESLKDIINKEFFVKTHKELHKGIRTLDICSRCSMVR